MTPIDEIGLQRTRRHFFGQCGLSLGSMALLALERRARAAAIPGPAPATAAAPSPFGPRPPHFPAKAKSVIFLFMAGGPSHLELFDPKPMLAKLHGQLPPESFTKGKRFAFIKPDATLLGCKRKFARHGDSGAELSELLPHTAKIADKIAVLRSMKTDVFNHGPAKVFLNTGSPRFGRPAMGAWATYGLGSEADDLPGFVVLNSGPRGPRGGTSLYASGFLPTSHQGVPFRESGDPILNLSSPPGVDLDRQRQTIDAVN